MNFIQHTFEPQRLFLVWQAPDQRVSRSRRVVGEVLRMADPSRAVFRYLTESDDYIAAREEGFEGYPAFKLSNSEHTHGVLDAFMRRLPPRNREDFVEYLSRHRISSSAGLSDFALLAYTGGKLPSDGFEFSADFTGSIPPLELVIEVAGFRYCSPIPASALQLGHMVEFHAEPNNVFDHQAIAVMYSGARIGYVGRVLARAFNQWMRRGYSVTGVIERVNGKPERPAIYLFVKVRPSDLG